MRLNLAVVLAHRHNQILFISLWIGLAVSKPDMIAHLEDGKGPWVVVREISRTPCSGELIRTSRMGFIIWMKQNIWNIGGVGVGRVSFLKAISEEKILYLLPSFFSSFLSPFFSLSFPPFPSLSVFYFWFPSHPTFLSSWFS